MKVRGVLRVCLVLCVGYFAVDMLTPEIPGAFTFDLDQSVEALANSRGSSVPMAAVDAHPVPRLDDSGHPRPAVIRHLVRASETARRLPASSRRPSVAHDSSAASIDAD